MHIAYAAAKEYKFAMAIPFAVVQECVICMTCNTDGLT